MSKFSSIKGQAELLSAVVRSLETLYEIRRIVSGPEPFIAEADPLSMDGGMRSVTLIPEDLRKVILEKVDERIRAIEDGTKL